MHRDKTQSYEALKKSVILRFLNGTGKKLEKIRIYSRSETLGQLMIQTKVARRNIADGVLSTKQFLSQTLCYAPQPHSCC